MRKVILQLAVSLDGFIEGSNGEYDWCFTDQDYGMAAFFNRIDTVFYGRKSYELVQAMSNVESSDFPAMPKLKAYVFSSTIKNLNTGATLISGDVETEVNRVKSEPGKDIWLFGGASLTSSLLNLRLVDEISLAIHPILLGSGKPLFQGIQDRQTLKLVETKSYSSGLVAVTYAIE